MSNPYGSVEKLWGNSKTFIQGVGKNGTIVYNYGQTWQQIVGGTEVDLFDIWGSDDGTLWTCGYSNDYGTTALLRFSGTGWENVYKGSGSNQSNGYYIGPLSGVWSTGNQRIYLMNWNGIYIQANSDELFFEKELTRFSSASYGIDGTGDNNIFVCGVSFIGHWNGVTYKEYPELYQENRRFLNVDVKENIVCSVGRDYNDFIYSEAVIALSK